MNSQLGDKALREHRREKSEVRNCGRVCFPIFERRILPSERGENGWNLSENFPTLIFLWKDFSASSTFFWMIWDDSQFRNQNFRRGGNGGVFSPIHPLGKRYSGTENAKPTSAHISEWVSSSSGLLSRNGPLSNHSESVQSQKRNWNLRRNSNLAPEREEWAKMLTRPCYKHCSFQSITIYKRGQA